MSEFGYRYRFSSETMRQTTVFDLMETGNLQRLGISVDQIDRIDYFEYLPGTLYPEIGHFSANHPCGGSFGVHIHLSDGRDAWLYGRVSYDYNTDRDHQDGQRHWNYDVVGIRPDGTRLDPYADMSYHVLPDSRFLQIQVERERGQASSYRIVRP